MANKVPPTPIIARPPLNADVQELPTFGHALVSSVTQTFFEHAARINNSLPMDGTEAMEGVLRIQLAGAETSAQESGSAVLVLQHGAGFPTLNILPLAGTQGRIQFTDPTGSDAYVLFDVDDGRMFIGPTSNTTTLELQAGNNGPCLTISEQVLTIESGRFIRFDDDGSNLDRYLEGSWTPVLTTDGTDFDSVTHDIQQGWYTLIGNALLYGFRLRTDAVTKGSASGTVSISGLPIAVAADTYNTCAIRAGPGWAGDTPRVGTVNSGDTHIGLFVRSATPNIADPDAGCTVADVATGANSNFILGTGWYPIA